MRSERLAEVALSVVSPPERAAAAVGDLLELAPLRGRFWFWASILRTAVATVWRHLREAPVLLTFYAAIALIGYVLVFALLFVALAQLLVILWLAGESLGLSGDTIGDAAVLLEASRQLLTFGAAYLSGRRIAHLWRERAVALMMALVGWLLMLALVLIFAAPGRRPMQVPMLLLSIVPFMMVGVVRQRLRTLRKSPTLTTA